MSFWNIQSLGCLKMIRQKNQWVFDLKGGVNPKMKD
jgi:hypothetical protein